MFSRKRNCDSCGALLDEKHRLEHSLHQTELKLVKAETLVEVHRQELQRLERVLAGQQGPQTGGFVTQVTPVEPEAPAAPDAPDFSQRIDEVFGTGLSLEEILRRSDKYRKNQLESAQTELTALRSEMQRIPQ